VSVCPVLLLGLYVGGALLGMCNLVEGLFGCPFHPSKFLILEEEDDGRRGGRMVATVYYSKIILKEN
jgi:hypothetical protein